MGRLRNAVLDWAVDGPRAAIANLLSTRARSPQTTSSMQYGVEKWTDWNTKKAVIEGYESHWLVSRLIQLRADAQVSIPIIAKDISTKDATSDTHPASKMIYSPNPKISMDDLKFRVELFLCLAGDAYWYINQLGDSVRLDPLRSDRVSIKVLRARDSDDGVEKHIYLYTIPGNKPVPFAEDEIVHFKNYSPSSDLFGQPVLRANAKLVDTGNAITDFQYHSMINGMWPSGTISTGMLEKTQYDRLMAQMKEFKEGPANARKAIVIEDGRGFVPATPTPAEMDFMGGSNLTNQELCTGFGVFAESTGLVPAKFENMRASEVATYNATYIPSVKKFVATLNIQLAPHFDGIYFDYDLSGTPPMVDKRKANAEEGKKYFDMGISTRAINERLSLGFDEKDCPEDGYISVKLLPVDAARDTVDEGRAYTAVEMMRLPREKRARILERSADSAVLDLHYRATDRKRLGWERGVAQKVSSLFTAESSAVVKAITNGHTDTDAAIESQRGAWVKTFTAVYRAVIEDFGEETFDELVPRTIDMSAVISSPSDVSGERISDRGVLLHSEKRDFDPWSEEIEKYVNAHAAAEVKLIQDTTKKAIRAIVLKGIKDGDSSVKIARSIKEVFKDWEGGTDTYRAMMIARTEVHQAAGTAMHESARQSGVAKQKAWLDAGDDRVRTAHVNNTGQGWIPFGDTFSDGADYPGDGTNDVNCRCVGMYKG